MIKILILTPVWQRPEIFDICLEGIKRLVKYNPAKFKIQPFFIISESWAAQVLNKSKYDYIFHGNETLGAKKNAGLRYALKNYEFDYVLEIGSDDLLSNQWLDIAAEYLEAGEPQFYPSKVHFVDTISGKTAEWESQKIIGLGRFISRKAIETLLVKTELWDNTANRGMDTYSMNQLMRIGIGKKAIDTSDKILALDIKSEVNINQIHHFTPSQFNADEIIASFPEGPKINKALKPQTC